MLKDWISEARPRTLLLSASNCSLGCALGFYYGSVDCFNMMVAALIVTTGMLMQIISNLANDYGDAVRGSDTEQRLGPVRGVMTGAISLNQLKRAMAMVIVLTAIVGLLAIILSVGDDLNTTAWFVFLGVVSIVAALFYTLGMAYGYKGLGDVAVFIFFGVLAVIGPQLMITNVSGSGLEVYPDSFLLCISVGMGSVMLLNVANMRDIVEDSENGKKTLAVRFGRRFAAFYHMVLFAMVTAMSFLACFLSHKSWEISILGVSLIPLFATTYRAVTNVHDGSKIAPELKFTALGVFFHHSAWIAVLIMDYWIYQI